MAPVQHCLFLCCFVLHLLVQAYFGRMPATSRKASSTACVVNSIGEITQATCQQTGLFARRAGLVILCLSGKREISRPNWHSSRNMCFPLWTGVKKQTKKATTQQLANVNPRPSRFPKSLNLFCTCHHRQRECWGKMVLRSFLKWS